MHKMINIIFFIIAHLLITITDIREENSEWVGQKKVVHECYLYLLVILTIRMCICSPTAIIQVKPELLKSIMYYKTAAKPFFELPRFPWRLLGISILRKLCVRNQPRLPARRFQRFYPPPVSPFKPVCLQNHRCSMASSMLTVFTTSSSWVRVLPRWQGN